MPAAATLVQAFANPGKVIDFATGWTIRGLPTMVPGAVATAGEWAFSEDQEDCERPKLPRIGRAGTGFAPRCGIFIRLIVSLATVFLLAACTLVIPVWTYGGAVGKAGSS